MKRYLALLTAALMLLSFCACTRPADPAQDPDVPDTQEPETPEDQTPDEPQNVLPDGSMSDPYDLGWNTPCVSASGTGEKKTGTAPAVLSFCTDIFDTKTETRIEDGCTVYLPTVTFRGFRNLLLMDTIQSDVQASIDDLYQRRPDTSNLPERMAARGAEAANAEYYIGTFAWVVGDLLCIRNTGTLSVTYSDASGSWLDGETSFVYAGTMLYDLRDGHKMTLSELFSEDTDYMTAINTAVGNGLAEYELTRPFRGLPADYPQISVTAYGLQVELTDCCPYIDSGYNLTEQGTTLYLDLSGFWRDMPILWGDCSSHFENTEIGYTAPGQFELTLAPHNVTLPGNTDNGPLSVNLPRIDAGVAESVMTTVNTQLDTLETGLLSQAETWCEEVSSGGEHNWCWIEPSYNFAGPYFHVSYSLSISTDSQNRNMQTDAVFDLRTGNRVFLRDLLTDPETAEQSLVSLGLTAAEAASALDDPNFGLNSMLYLWGSVGQGDAAVAWSLEASQVNFSLFGEE